MLFIFLELQFSYLKRKIIRIIFHSSWREKISAECYSVELSVLMEMFSTSAVQKGNH